MRLNKKRDEHAKSDTSKKKRRRKLRQGKQKKINNHAVQLSRKETRVQDNPYRLKYLFINIERRDRYNFHRKCIHELTEYTAKVDSQSDFLVHGLKNTSRNVLCDSRTIDEVALVEGLKADRIVFFCLHTK